MGADIHMYVEHSPKTYAELEEGGERYWFAFGRINPGCDPRLFALLANVRGQGALFPPRGAPRDAAYEASSDNRLYITTSAGDKYVKPEDAARWVADGSSTYILKHDGTPGWVTHPDWHSHSWLTPDELAEVFAAYKDAHQGQSVGIEYTALLAAMRALEDSGENDVRVVFWFDN